MEKSCECNDIWLLIGEELWVPAYLSGNGRRVVSHIIYETQWGNKWLKTAFEREDLSHMMDTSQWEKSPVMMNENVEWPSCFC